MNISEKLTVVLKPYVKKVLPLILENNEEKINDYIKELDKRMKKKSDIHAMSEYFTLTLVSRILIEEKDEVKREEMIKEILEN